jgi:subtilisin family serine protease
MQIKKALLGLSLLSLGACGGMEEVGQEPTTEVATVEKFIKVGRPARDQYIVVFKNDAKAEVSSLVGTQGQVLYTYNGVLKGFAARMSESAARELAKRDDVAYVTQDEVVDLFATQSTGTTYFNLDRVDQRALPLSQTYNYTTTGAGVNVYVVDTGIRATHTQFAGRVGAGFTSITDGQGTNDCQGHGTHVSGTVGGSTSGIAKGVTLYPVRVFGCTGSTTTAAIVSGVDWIRLNHRKPAVANLSLGGGANTTIDTAINNLIAAGVTVVVAAGNSNLNACNYSPARVPGAITVGSTTSTDARSSFSNFGSCVDIFAPGSSITSAAFSGDTATSVLSGTSMASPLVAGLAARYLQANPTASPAAVASYLTSNATTGVVGSAGTGSPNRLAYLAPNL